jgi:hypothetical protein
MPRGGLCKLRRHARLAVGIGESETKLAARQKIYPARGAGGQDGAADATKLGKAVEYVVDISVAVILVGRSYHGDEELGTREASGIVADEKTLALCVKAHSRLCLREDLRQSLSQLS